MSEKTTIFVKKDEETGEHYIDFEDLKCMFDNPEEVDSYSLKTTPDGVILLSFFDKNKNKILPNKK